jgi:hypothetical protein
MVFHASPIAETYRMWYPEGTSANCTPCAGSQNAQFCANRCGLYFARAAASDSSSVAPRTKPVQPK